MKIHYKQEVVVNTSSEKVWEVVGKKFPDIGGWASGVSSSSSRENESG